MNISIIAHRGASSLAKQENTMEAFKIAIDIKADMVEFDVRQTFDNMLVVFHDDNIDGNLLSSITYYELNKISQKLGYTVPLLKDVLIFCKGKIKLDIEIKETGFEKSLIEMVTSMYDYNEFMIKSFLDNVVRRVKKYDSNINAGLLLGRQKGNLSVRFNEIFPLRRIKQCQADFIAANYRLCNSIFLLRMQQLNIPVYVWTVNSKKLINYFLDTSVAGIITDKPDAAIFLRSQKLIGNTKRNTKVYIELNNKTAVK